MQYIREHADEADATPVHDDPPPVPPGRIFHSGEIPFDPALLLGEEPPQSPDPPPLSDEDAEYAEWERAGLREGAEETPPQDDVPVTDPKVVPFSARSQRTSGNGAHDDAGQSGGDHGDQREAPGSDDDVAAEAREIMEWWRKRCAVPLRWLAETPLLRLVWKVGHDGSRWIGFLYKDVDGPDEGYAVKWRRMPQGGPDRHGEDDILWENCPKPPPLFYPPVPLDCGGATTLVIPEGESCTTLACYAYDGDPDVVVAGLAGGVNSAKALTPRDVETLYDRGLRRAIIIMDRDDAGQDAAQALIDTMQQARMPFEPIPLDLRPLMPDPLAGGMKDLRDFRRFWTPEGQEHVDPAQVRAALAILRSAEEDAMHALVRSGTQFLADTDEENNFIVEDVLATGCLHALGAAPGTGKTGLVYTLLHALRGGEDFIGFKSVPARVLYLSEEPKRIIKSRLQEIARFDAAAATDFPHVHFITYQAARDAGLLGDGTLTALRAAREATRLGAEVVIVDTFLPWSGVDDVFDPSIVTKAFRPWHALADAGFAVLLLLQNRKAGGFHGEEFAFSHQIIAEFDIAYSYGFKSNKDEDRCLRVLKIQKNREVRRLKGEKIILKEGENGRIVRASPAKTAAQDEDKHGVRAYLESTGPAGTTAAEATAALNKGRAKEQHVSKDTVRRDLNALVTKGTARKEKENVVGQRRGGQVDRFFFVQPMDLSRLKVHPS